MIIPATYYKGHLMSFNVHVRFLVFFLIHLLLLQVYEILRRTACTQSGQTMGVFLEIVPFLRIFSQILEISD